MQTLSVIEATNDWHKLTEAAQRQPVRVQAEGEPEVVVMSAVDYDRYRRLIGERLLATMDRIGAKASAAGLTEDKLDELLADES